MFGDAVICVGVVMIVVGGVVVCFDAFAAAVVTASASNADVRMRRI